MSTTYSIQDTTLTSLGNAVRKVWGTEDTFTPAQMANSIEELGFGVNVNNNNISSRHINPLTNRWQRPSEWPDIDALADEIVGDQDCVYFTYDLSVHEDFHHLGLYVEMSQGDTWYLDRYDEGEFVHTHFETSKSDSVRYDLTEEPDNSSVQIWRLTSNGHISKWGFTTWTSNSGSTNMSPIYQPCVDRSGTLPWIIGFYTSNSSNLTTTGTYGNITRWLEHDSLVIGKNTVLTTLSSYWSGAENLVSIDVSKWNTENWNITSLSNCWTNCYSLKELKLNYWDTTNWHVTNLSSTWNNCRSLEYLEIDQWDIKNWPVSSLSSTWYQCYALQMLNLNNWNTDIWTINSLSSVWSGCRSLTELKIDQWNTENWAITTMNYTWQNCHSLKKLDLNNWNTENWAVTTMYGVWYGCYNLTSLKINLWDTSNWVITSCAYVWQNCYRLEKCEIENWDTSKWNPTSFSSMWSNCYSLKTLDLSKWDTSKWNALTSLSSAWSNCYALQELKISSLLQNNFTINDISSAWMSCHSLKQLDLNNWNTTNWTITSLSQTWYACYNLIELNIDKWDTSNWALASLGSCIADCMSLKELDLSSWDASNWNITSITFSVLYSITNIKWPQNFNWSSFTSAVSFSNCPALQNISNISQPISHSYNNNYKLTSTCLKNILNDLPTVSSTKTITLGAINKAKLTAADLAVATNKGWTVA